MANYEITVRVSGVEKSRFYRGTKKGAEAVIKHCKAHKYTDAKITGTTNLLGAYPLDDPKYEEHDAGF